MEILAANLTVAYYAVCALLTVLGLYRAAILLAWLRPRTPRQPDTEPARWPRVTVQLPIYNERFVARRLLQAVAALDYPPDRLQIQVLDDSTDSTRVLTRRIVRVLRRRGLDVEHVHRPRRAGFKAGALANGLRSATGELVAIFDADFVPARDFLRRTVPALLAPGVGVVQTRWGHLNRESSWFTRLQAILLDGHFAIEQPARWSNAWLLTFNGTAGIWRRQAIEAAGGWQSDTLTEDLDLSIRAQLAGWKIRYLEEVVVPAELPTDPNSFRAQQRRWAKGGVQVARKMLPRIAGAALPWHAKIEAMLHMSSYAAYPLLILLALLRTPARVLAPESSWAGLLPGELVLLTVGTLPLAAYYVLAQRAAGAPGGLRRWLLDVFPAMALGAGLAVGNAIAVLEGLFGKGLVFERTPKRGELAAEHADPLRSPAPGRARQVRHPRLPAYRAPGARIAVLEILLLAYLVLCKVLYSGRSLFGEFPFLSFFAFGLLAMSAPSLHEAWCRARSRRAVPATAVP